jgi:hypothetical protein
MDKKTNAIYLLADYPFLNTKHAHLFGKLNLNDSIFLYSQLFTNNLRNLTGLHNKANIVCCLDRIDEEFILKNFIPEEVNLYFLNTKNISEQFVDLNTKFFQHHLNNVLIHFNTFGVSLNKFVKMFDLLSIEDESIVIGKTDKDKVGFIGSNNLNEEIYKEFFLSKLNYEKYLADVSNKDNFVNVLSGFLAINDMEDFKSLYDELSKKESLEYCSQEMHERFTHLFIEYRELLK